MKRKHKFLAALAICGVIALGTGCPASSSSQTQSTVNALIAMIQSAADYIATVSNHSSAISEINESCSLAGTAFNTWIANPSASNLTNLQSEIATFQTKLPSIFQSFGITDTHTQALVTLTIGEISALVQLVPAVTGGSVTTVDLPKPEEFRARFNDLAGQQAL